MEKSPNMETLKESQEQYWNDFRDQFLEDCLEDITSDYENQDEDSQKYIRSKANTEFEKFASKKLNSFIKECKAKKEIWIRDEYPFNKGWIVNDEKIKNKLKQYPKLFDVLNFIDNEANHIENIGIEDRTTFTVKTAKGTELRKWSHVIVGKDFYLKAEKAIGLKKNAMQKYINAFCKMGSLKKIGHLKSHNRAMLYIDGYHRPVGEIGRMKKERLMNQKDHQQALRDFKYK